MGYWACEFYIAHLISTYPRINKFYPTLFAKFLVVFFFLRSLDNFHKHKFHFLQVQKFFRKIIHLFQAY
ncbi:uncharacterized protein DS421_16g545120 [Arachis hypogaea]|nr:uncharacterized protein DS421_16g545120 [Arachis hypogaea]